MRLLSLALLLTLCTSVRAQELQFFESFADHAILQRNIDHPIWGWAKPNAKITVSFNGGSLQAKTDKSGRWEVTLPATKAGGPYKISAVAGREKNTIKDVYFGDVYLLSGQSNMEWSFMQSDADGTRGKAIADPLIRELRVKRSFDVEPREHLEIRAAFSDGWRVGDAEGMKLFSAVGSYFAHYLRKEVDVPIGLLHSSWGGSRIEPWMRPEAIAKVIDVGDYRDALNKAGMEGRRRFAEDFPGRNVPVAEDGNNKKWLGGAVNDASWPTMELPVMWENAGYTNVDGLFYFRKTVRLTAAQAAGKATLFLGAIDDSDITYVNGKEVGSLTNAYSTKRKYGIPKGMLRAGENTIAVRVEDTGGGGGFSGSSEQMKLETAAGTIALAGDWKFNIGKFVIGGNNKNQIPVILFNAMIAPLGEYPMTAVLWYQGESNSGEKDNLIYSDLMKGIITDWRGFFGNPDLPFYWVSLANFTAPVATPNEPGWAVLRQSQTDALALPNTGQAIITDIGEANDIHPKNKWDVGYRLSLHALKNIYGKDVQAASPILKKVHKIEGMTVIEFDEVGRGLMVKSDDRYGYPSGFTVMDDKGKWHFAHALLDPTDNMIAIVNPAGTGIKMVRYNWASNPDGNLFSKDGLPVTPFEVEVE